MKTKINLEIIGHDPELYEFLRLCRLIQTFGDLGTSRKINVKVDGDGSGHLQFKVIASDGVTDLPSFDGEYIENNDTFKIDIGE